MCHRYSIAFMAERAPCLRIARTDAKEQASGICVPMHCRIGTDSDRVLNRHSMG
jgi:hypothetical protein